VGLIGISPSGNTFIERFDPFTAAYRSLIQSWRITELTILSIVKIIEGKISAKTIGGPILIAQLAGQQAKAGALSLIIFMAVISINLVILNILPIPILDGGHLLLFLIEGAIGRPISLKIRERAQQIGVFIIILLMLLVFYNDLSRIMEHHNPMLILAIETSTLTGSIALMETPLPKGELSFGEKILGETTLNIAATHSARLMPVIDSLLRETSRSIHEVQGIVLGLGPGSFTGLRIAASTVKGLAYALRVPVVGVPPWMDSPKMFATPPHSFAPSWTPGRKRSTRPFSGGTEKDDW